MKYCLNFLIFYQILKGKENLIKLLKIRDLNFFSWLIELRNFRMKHETLLSNFQEVGDFLLMETIGKGAFSNVKRASNLYSHENAAVKIIDKNKMSNDMIQNEINFLEEMDHPFICKPFQVIETDSNFYIFMEFIEGGSLFDIISNSGPFSEDIARHYFVQLLSVLDYIHNTLNIIHRDIKIENILIDKFNNIKMIDFGLSHLNNIPENLCKTACGSVAYAAPEMLKSIPYSSKCDLWSVGIVLYILVFGRFPFEDLNVNKLIQKIVLNEPNYDNTYNFIERRNPLSSNLIDLIQRLLKKNPNERISLNEIFYHPWISIFPFIDKYFLKINNLKDLSSIEIDLSNFQNLTNLQKKVIEKMKKRNYLTEKLSNLSFYNNSSSLTNTFEKKNSTIIVNKPFKPHAFAPSPGKIPRNSSGGRALFIKQRLNLHPKSNRPNHSFTEIN